MTVRSLSYNARVHAAPLRDFFIVADRDETSALDGSRLCNRPALVLCNNAPVGDD
ncbi:MAG: hypothetical protein ACREYE_15270 [Gammaproteobacteria bacterium]